MKFSSRKISVFFCVGFCVASALLFVLFYRLPDGRLHVKALDIGQGDAILIQTPQGKNILIDGGPGPTVLEKLNEEMNFFDNTIDLMILTHPHADHVDGLVEVLKRYKVLQVLITGVTYSNPMYFEVQRLIYENNIRFDFARADTDYFVEPEVYLDIIYPTDSLAGTEFDNLNDSSIVAKLVYGDKSVLLTGDAELEEEHAILMTDQDVSATLLKAGHHGSRTSGSPDFIAAVRPEQVIISAGKDNNFGHPHPETIALYEREGIPYLVTKDVGTIEVDF